jgi:hypothetical protein
MSELKAPPAELHAVMTITRKATGVVETYNIIGHISAEENAKLLKAAQEQQNDGNTQHGGT